VIVYYKFKEVDFLYAIIDACGRQYKVSEGQTLDVEKLNSQVGEKVVFDKVITLVDGENVEIGKPFLENVKVVAEVVGHLRGRKVMVIKRRPRKGYRLNKGHRQWYTRIKIEKIEK
jgi:large subunit ribosomal protein L21